MSTDTIKNSQIALNKAKNLSKSAIDYGQASYSLAKDTYHIQPVMDRQSYQDYQKHQSLTAEFAQDGAFNLIDFVATGGTFNAYRQTVSVDNVMGLSSKTFDDKMEDYGSQPQPQNLMSKMAIQAVRLKTINQNKLEITNQQSKARSYAQMAHNAMNRLSLDSDTPPEIAGKLHQSQKLVNTAMQSPFFVPDAPSFVEDDNQFFK